MKTLKIDCRDMKTVKEAHACLKRSLGFPDYYGANLDALADCLSEFGADTYIVFEYPEEILPDNRKYAEKMMQVFEDVSERPGGFKLIINETETVQIKTASEEIFTTKSENYAAARPSYAKAAIELVMSNLQPGDKVADIGSGTGIMSKEFIERGFETYCVEPNAAMRSKAEESYAQNENFHSVSAGAENTTLEEHSIKLVCAASAFHWFDAEAFKKECRRILTDDGIVCLLINVREYDDFTRRQHEICLKYCEKFTSLAHGFEKTEKAAEKFFEGGYRIERFDFPLEYSKEKFIARSLSSSYSLDEESKDYKEYVQALRELADTSSDADKLCIANSTVVFIGKP